MNFRTLLGTCLIVLCLVPAHGSPSIEESQFIAAVVRTDETSLEVWINPRREWQNEGKLVSRYTEEEGKAVADIVYRLKLCAHAGARFKLCKPGRSLEDVKRDLEDAGVEVEAEFQHWAEESRSQ